MSRKEDAFEEVNVPDGTYEGEGGMSEEPHSDSQDELEKYSGDFANAVAEELRDESTLDEFMEALMNDEPLEPDEIGRSEEWPGNFALVETQQTPSGDIWGDNGARKYRLQETPESRYTIVKETRSELGLPEAKLIGPADEYINEGK